MHNSHRLVTCFTVAVASLMARTIALGQQPVAATGAPPTAAQMPAGGLERGATLERSLPPGESHEYTIQLLADDFLEVRIIQREADVAVWLTDSTNQALSARGRQRLLWIAQQSGSYNVHVEGPSQRRAAVRYAIVLESLRPATTQDRARLKALALAVEGDRLGRRDATDKRRAVETWEAARIIWREADDLRGQTEALLRIAHVRHQLGETDKALEACRAALEVAGRLGDARLQAEAEASMSRTQAERGQTADALASIQRAAALYEAAGDRLGQHIALQSLAVTYTRLGDYQSAVERLERVLEFVRGTGNQVGEAFTLDSLGFALRGLGDFQGALRSGELAVKTARALKDRNLVASFLIGLGRTYSLSGKSELALQSFEEARTLFHELGNNWREATVGHLIGAQYVALGDNKRARQWLDDALVGLRAAADTAEEAATLADLAQAERGLGNISAAVAHVEAALDLFETTRNTLSSTELRALYLASKHRAYELAIDLLATLDRDQPDHGFAAAALAMSERARARTLLDLLAEAGVDVEQSANPSLVAKRLAIETSLKERAAAQLKLAAGDHTRDELAEAEHEISRLTKELGDIRAQLRASQAGQMPFATTPLSPAEIQQLLDPDTLLLEYALGEPRSYVFAVTASAVAVHALPGRDQIQRAARQVHQKLSSVQASGAPSTNADALGRLLLAPLGSSLRAPRLVIVADGALQYIPLGVLRLPQGRPLIEEHTIVYLPSASTLGQIRNRRFRRDPPQKFAAVFADPVFSPADARVTGRAKAGDHSDSVSLAQRSAKEAGVFELDRLFASRKEAAVITRLARGQPVLEALDFEANRDRVFDPQLGQYRIVHFATHALLNSKHPELSGLVLSLVDASGRPENGFLQVHEIYNLKLSADLVVLSACETALGTEIRGEGLIGLTRAFLYAGAQSVVASLWRVPDAATAELMRRFYTALLEDGVRPAEALRQAQRSLKRTTRWASPYYWAGFTVQGEWL